jgi:hypothetical protein
VACLPGGECFSGTCGCPAETAQCSNPPGCYDLDTDADHCGDCATSCDGDEACSLGLCCPVGWERCSEPVDGCYDVSTDEDHCGGCDVQCEPTEVCVGGDCTCPSGTHACPSLGGCFADDDDDHCGDQCVVCPAGRSCQLGVCACDAGTVDCGTCVDLETDAAHCGACDHACSTTGFPGAACEGALCRHVEASGTLALGTTKSLTVDATTDQLYSLEVSGSASNGLLHRFDALTASGTAPTGLNPIFSAASLSAANGDLAFAAKFVAGPLSFGPFLSFSQSPTIPEGVSVVEHVDGAIYFGAGGCLRRAPAAPMDVECFPSTVLRSIVELPTDATRALVHPVSTAGTQGQVVLVNLVTDGVEATLTSFPIPQRAEATGASIAVDQAGTQFFFFGLNGANGISLYRRDFSDSTPVELVDVGAGGGIGLLRDGDRLYFSMRAGNEGRIYEASVVDLGALSQPSASVATLLTTYPLTNAEAGDFVQDSDALYFVDEGKVYRLRKPPP